MTVSLAAGGVVLGASAWLAAACASSGARSGQQTCVLAPADSGYLAGGPVYPPCAVDRSAQLLNPRSAQPDFRSSELPPGGAACYTAEVQFVVDTVGLPESRGARLVRANHPEWGDAVLASVMNWRYKPARRDGVAVRQIVHETRSRAISVILVGSGAGPSRRRPPRC